MNIQAFLLILICFLCNIHIDAQQKAIYKGAFKCNPAYKMQMSGLPIYYKGEIYFASSEKEGNMAHFEFSDRKISTLFILITEHPPLPIDNTTMEFLKLSSKHIFKLFKLRKTTSIDSSNGELLYSWRVEDVSSDYTSCALPDPTIIVLTHPDNIEEITAIAWHKDDAMIPLPTLCFNKDIKQAELEDLLSKMQIALMDVKIFHKRSDTNKKLFGTQCVVCAPHTKSELL